MGASSNRLVRNASVNALEYVGVLSVYDIKFLQIFYIRHCLRPEGLELVMRKISVGWVRMRKDEEGWGV